MVNFYDTISMLDIFGRPISLMFNNKGEFHRTAVGGCLTITMMIAIIIFTGFSG